MNKYLYMLKEARYEFIQTENILTENMVPEEHRPLFGNRCSSAVHIDVHWSIISELPDIRSDRSGSQKTMV